MLSRALIGDDSASSSGSSDSMTEKQYSSQIPVKTKPEYTNFKSWTFLDTIQADVLAGQFEERKRTLIEHFRTRTTPGRPICVRSVTIFEGFETACPGSAQ